MNVARDEGDSLNTTIFFFIFILFVPRGGEVSVEGGVDMVLSRHLEE